MPRKAEKCINCQHYREFYFKREKYSICNKLNRIVTGNMNACFHFKPRVKNQVNFPFPLRR